MFVVVLAIAITVLVGNAECWWTRRRLVVAFVMSVLSLSAR